MTNPFKVRAKFLCNSMEINLDGKGGFLYNYKFNAVYSGSEENKKFFAYTPSGTMQLSSVRDDLFEIGKEYYLDFSLAVEPEPA
jgi:hypothetical protein